MNLANKQKNVVVIGGGLAGIVAAAAAAGQGAAVTLATSGPGTLALGGGSISFAGMDTGRSYLKPAVQFFQEITAAAGCDYRGNSGTLAQVPTAMGSFQAVSMAPAAIWAGRPVAGSRVLVTGIRGLSGFNAGFTAELLTAAAAQAGLEMKYSGLTVVIPWLPNGSFNTLDAANYLETESNRDKLARILQPLAKGYHLVLLPAILGHTTASSALARFTDIIGCPAGELNTVPPAVTGLRIYSRLQKYLQQAGVEMNLAYPVQTLQIRDGRCAAAVLATPGRKRVIRADSFIIASGRINQYKVVIDKDSSGNSEELQVDAAANEYLQLLDNENRPVAANLFGAGSLLADYNRQSGNALAILTGYQAGILAAGG
ncbi:Anaerobic glycerol-3-phosphate dehydrogenase [Dendrosporobacter quercicolus]|uniref:Anaerobic glycerol-3-phosphate dehydrogenase n=1 Tax=Dendrosporobacter quercicolus TaxID=146817 RepID=A0A1G9XB69_9FIRM|nr:Anaerobic glycerol-3-phosphate dehydrogenase [Dendrosporobacter quercicolus]